MVVQDPGEDQDVRNEMLKDYRRLFSSLNRYAKATDQSTNIIMDEDDGIAILTRRLIAEHAFFKWTVQDPSEYSIVKTGKGKNLRPTDPYFTQIEVLYDINLKFLTSSSRSAQGWEWRPSEQDRVPHKDFKKIWRVNRPDEQVLENYHQELTSIWNGLLEVLPDLRRSPTEMRIHNPVDGQDNGGSQDHVLFWPIGQKVLATVVRQLLDDFNTIVVSNVLSESQVVQALTPLARVQWSLHRPPWRHLLLVQTRDRSGNQSWTMRNEGRAQAIDVAQDVLEFIVGVTTLGQEGQDNLRQRWQENLVPEPDETTAKRMWNEIIDQAVGTS